MSEKYPGGFVTYNPPTPSQTSATGIWTLSQQEQYQQAGLWPNSPSQVSRSLRFNSADSAFLRRTPTYASNRQTWTWSGWVKRSAINGTYQNIFQTIGAAGGDNDYFSFRIMNGEQIGVVLYSYFPLISTQVLRDVSAWYHFVCVLDTTQATASNRLKIYINGVEVTAWSTDNRSSISQNSNLGINSAAQHNIGAYSGSSEFFSGYMANVQFVDGQALTPTSFGEFNVNTGVWQPLQKNLTYGTNGFQLTFNDNTNTTATTLGADSSGNGNNWTPSNFSVTTGANNDSMVDSPTSYGTDTGVGGEVRGNYATLNPISTAGGTFTNGNLDWAAPTTDGRFCLATIPVNFMNCYCEVTIGSATSLQQVGVYGNPTTFNPRVQYRSDGQAQIDGVVQATYASYTANDIIGMSYNSSTGSVSFYKNGTLQGSMTVTSTSVTQYFAAGSNSSGATANYTFNFGQRAFAYTAPSGFKALCTQNLPTPTVGATSATTADKYFGINLWTGNGSSQTLTNSGGFQPDWVWLKSRSSGTNFHNLYDVLRGATKHLFSNSTAAEGTNAQALTAFTSTGFSVGNDNDVNQSSSTYVGWQWKANGAGVTNTAGSITSSVSANTTAGFSVVTFTGNGTAGATVGHGLGVAPSMVIVKSRSAASTNWVTYHTSSGATQYILLNTTGVSVTDSTPWNNTAPTSALFSLGTSSNTNGNTSTFVAYCFAPVAGYSAFGSYTGNGSADGPFVFTGFRPAFVMVKTSSVASQDWYILDSARDTYNLTANKLFPNSSNAENAAPNNSTSNALDFLSNGFKLKTTNDGTNQNAGTYIYMAFASNPFKYSLAR